MPVEEEDIANAGTTPGGDNVTSEQVLELPAEEEAAATKNDHTSQARSAANGRSPAIPATQKGGNASNPNSPLLLPRSGSTVHYDQAAMTASPSKGRFQRRLRPEGNGDQTRDSSSGSHHAREASASSLSLHDDRRSRNASFTQGGTSNASLAAARERLNRHSQHLSIDGGGSVHNESHKHGSTRSKSTARQKVQTIPPWARDEPPSPHMSPSVYGSPAVRSLASPQMRAVGSPASRARNSPHLPPMGSLADINSLSPLPPPVTIVENGHDAPEDAPVEQGTSAQEGDVRHEMTMDELNAAGESARGPERFWAFTLPAKYRERLHEHHLRMASTPSSSSPGSPSERDARKSRVGSEDTPYKVSREKSSKRHRGHHHHEAESDDGSDNDGDADRTLTRRYSGDGRGAWQEALSALGASGLMSRKNLSRAQQQEGSKTGPNPVDGQEDDSSTRSTSPEEGEKGGVTSGRSRTGSFTRRQPTTPGWSSPWRPESRGGNSIEIGRYRFGADGAIGKVHGGYFPRTETGRSSEGRSKRSRRGKRRRQNAKAGKGEWEWWRNFLLHNPFVPLLFRFINVSFTTATLAVAIRVHLLLRKQGTSNLVGSSPILAIVFAPLSIVHVAFQVVMEYRGRPLGLWGTSSKLFYTLIEVIFVCFWSAELALSMDNYFTSPLVCAPFNTPFSGTRQVCIPDPDGTTGAPGAASANTALSPDRNSICMLQAALSGLCFVTLVAYVVVLNLSLFRIFVKIQGRHAGS